MYVLSVLRPLGVNQEGPVFQVSLKNFKIFSDMVPPTYTLNMETLRACDIIISSSQG
jgi:hypothetical protein